MSAAVRGAAAALAVLAMQAQPPAATPVARVELRRGEAPPPGRVAGLSPAGVELHDGPKDSPRVAIVTWDRVMAVEIDGADARPFLDSGERLWRARTRVERGDYPASEPLLDDLFIATEHEHGPTAQVTAELLLRCRLERGAQTSSVRAWLALVRSAESPIVAPAVVGTDWSARAGLPAVVDPATGLAPNLPPIWLAVPAVEAFAALPGPEGQARADRLARMYWRAARFEAGWRDPVDAGGLSGADDVVANIVLARCGDPRQRRDARGGLAQAIASDPAPWVEAWCRAGLGRSLLLEEDRADRLLGVASLLHVPGRFGRSMPYLSGVCLAEAAVALARSGDAAGGDRVRHRLLNEYPDHAALAWPPIRDWPATAPAPDKEQKP